MNSYKKGGKYGKLKGFDYYLRNEGKLRPNQRIDFLIKSEDYISKINQISATKFPYMDTNMSDLELLEIWNEIWWGCGWVIDEFKDKWFRERIGNGKEKAG
jgi:hypothetical protein